MKKLSKLIKKREFFDYKSEELVNMISPLSSQLMTSSRKVSVK